MAGEERRARGKKMFSEVYGGVVPLPPEENDEFLKSMLDTLFAEIWTRGSLSIRDRRLIIMGVLAAQGEGDVYGIQTQAALQKGELTAEQVQDILIMLTQYVGYPRTSKVRAAANAAVARVAPAAKS